MKSSSISDSLKLFRKFNMSLDSFPSVIFLSIDSYSSTRKRIRFFPIEFTIFRRKLSLKSKNGFPSFSRGVADI